MTKRQPVFTPYPNWLKMLDPIIEHCECCFQTGEHQGEHLHDRSWTIARLLRAFAERNHHILTGAVEGGLNSDLNDRRARRWARGR